MIAVGYKLWAIDCKLRKRIVDSSQVSGSEEVVSGEEEVPGSSLTVISYRRYSCGKESFLSGNFICIRYCTAKSYTQERAKSSH